MTSKKRVLLVHNFYQIGGGEHTVFENEKRLLLENGHEVTEYTRSNDELKKSKWKQKNYLETNDNENTVRRNLRD